MFSNRDLADVLAELASLTRVDDGSNHSFRARAYDTAARTIQELPVEAAQLSLEQLLEMDGIGRATASRIREFVDTGRVARLEELRQAYPPEFLELIRIPGLGPKRAVIVREALGVSSVADLMEALDQGKLREVPGLGEKTEQNLRKAVGRLGLSGKEHRVPILEAWRQARRLLEALQGLPGVEEVKVCGSFRRLRDTVADLDIAVAATDLLELGSLLSSSPLVKEVVAAGETKTTLITHSGLQVDVRVVRPDQWGSAILYFTGSTAHNIRLRRLAIERGLLLSEYGLSDPETGQVMASQTEEEVYRGLGLPWITPEMREDQGEIESAQHGTLPVLVQAGDLRGDLHVHTDLSGDGDHSLEDMVEAAARRGLEYLAITDHAENLTVNGADREQMLAQREQIKALQPQFPGLRLLHGAELNIGPDGTLDYDREFLLGYDWCVASVHSHFDLPATEQTQRLIKAMRHPAVNAVGHLLGRRIGKRPGIEIDVDAVLAVAEETGTAIEINSHLDRLDAPAEVLRAAQGREVLVVISTDAHRVSELPHSEWGVRLARRGWVDKTKVANTWPLARFLDWTEVTRRS